MIVNRGILTKRTICTVLSIFILPAALFVAALLSPMLDLTIINGAFLGAIVFVSLTLVLLRGWIVERLLATRLLSNSDGRLHFKDFKSKNVEHVLCCTELASGRPIYFSSVDGGRILIRLAEDERTERSGHSHLIKSCADLPVAAAVRSSVAFPPGISPRRLSLRSLGDAETESAHESRLGSLDPNAVHWPLFLSDGGVWNNLATQSLLEDKILKGGNATLFSTYWRSSTVN